MQEGTSIGLMTIVTIVGFGILFSILYVFMPNIRQVSLDLLQNGIKSAPTPN